MAYRKYHAADRETGIRAGIRGRKELIAVGFAERADTGVGYLEMSETFVLRSTLAAEEFDDGD
jgi:hypothetical protein